MLLTKEIILTTEKVTTSKKVEKGTNVWMIIKKNRSRQHFRRKKA